MALWLRNLAVAYDMKEYAKARYNLLGNGSHWFPGNRANQIDNLDFQNCLQNSPHADKIPQILAEVDEMLRGEEKKRLSQS